MSAPDLAVIGGTGLNALPELTATGAHDIVTPYGPPSAAVQALSLRGEPFLFLPRHGRPHRLPPHRINYRANLWALRELGVRRVVAVNAVGGVSPAMASGVIAIPDQIIDYTSGRAHTFYDHHEGGGAGFGVGALEHVDFSYPYTPSLRAALLEAAAGVAIHAVDGGVYGATQGPRLETAAEIGRMARDGCDLVGMTGMPEAALARELGLDYAAVCLVVNPAAGIAPGEITMAEIERVIADGMGRVTALLDAWIAPR